MRKPTQDEVRRLIAELEAWDRNFEKLMLLWPCPTCKAPLNEECVAKSGGPLWDCSTDYRRCYEIGQLRGCRLPKHRNHTRRQDLAAHASNHTPINVWGADLKDGVTPTEVFASIKRSGIYRRLKRLNLLSQAESTDPRPSTRRAALVMPHLRRIADGRAVIVAGHLRGPGTVH